MKITLTSSTTENYTKITDVEKTNYLIFILDRLICIDGNLEIVTRKVPLGEDIRLKDTRGNSSRFTPICVIHHRGAVTGNDTSGHYEADVLDKSSNLWFRTSDDMPPQLVPKNDITEQGYIFLYKKSQ